MNRQIKNHNGYLKKLRASFPRLAKKHGTPLFIISHTLLLAQLARFRKFLPRVEPFYAVKANPNPEVIKTLAAQGCGFDVASPPEIEWSLNAGALPERLIFANTIKKPAAIQYAGRHRVYLMTFDSEYELNKIARFCPRAKVVIRIKVPNVGSVVELSLKFGVEPVDAIPLLVKAKKLGLEPAGISFHVGSQCLQGNNYLDALEIARMLLNEAQNRDLNLKLIDIGGGFPIRHFDTDPDWFAEIAPALNLEISRLFPDDIRIIAEPGRAIVGPAGFLLLSVIGKSIRNNKHWYYLDDGVYGALSGMIFDHCKYQFTALKRGPTQLTTLAGPTCDSLDIISTAEELPELEIGDLLYVSNIGAYSIAHATHFNGIPPAKTIFVP
uniref:ornithine decarboxylase n=1 Tax=candidate division WOR-3 bacterium TaxID=2052148 RepID=A0A7V3PT43_UNCW3